MVGTPTRLGPFQGGLNTLSDPTAVADSELVDCVNFELDLDGSLTSRPPITTIGEAPGTNNIRLLGYYIAPNGTYYLIGSSDTGTYYFSGGAWTLITAALDAVAMVQYDERVYLLAGVSSAQNGGTWSPTVAFTEKPTMPKGSSIIAHKNRLWISPGRTAVTNGSRIRFSSLTNPGDPDDPIDWSDTDFFLDVTPGDGQNITDMLVHSNSILIFKNDSTYVFSYDSAPDRGIVSNISATQGASDVNCIVAYEDSVYLYHEGNIYEIINYNFNRLNTKVPFTVDNLIPSVFAITVSMSLFNDRLIVRHFDRVYVFNLRTRTWTRWNSVITFAYFITEPKNNLITDIPTAHAGSALAGDTNLYRIKDTFSVVDTEEMTCTFRTKNYDYQISSNFKKLHWWGADVVAQGIVNVLANPIIFSFSITYDQMALVSYDDLQTYDQPLDAVPVVATEVNAVGAGNRKFLKFMKALRFRQIFFTLSISNDGSSTSAPSKVFNLTTYISTKQTVSKSIS